MSQSQARPVIPDSPAEGQQAEKKPLVGSVKKDQRVVVNFCLIEKILQLTAVKGGALLSITLVNVAHVVGPEKQTLGHVRGQSHWVGDQGLDHIKVSRLHIHKSQ